MSSTSLSAASAHHFLPTPKHGPLALPPTQGVVYLTLCMGYPSVHEGGPAFPRVKLARSQTVAARSPGFGLLGLFIGLRHLLPIISCAASSLETHVCKVFTNKPNAYLIRHMNI